MVGDTEMEEDTPGTAQIAAMTSNLQFSARAGSPRGAVPAPQTVSPVLTAPDGASTGGCGCSTNADPASYTPGRIYNRYRLSLKLDQFLGSRQSRAVVDHGG